MDPLLVPIDRSFARGDDFGKLPFDNFSKVV